MIHPYADPRYAAAFGAGYMPVYLPQADLHVLKRPIPGTDRFDAMGPYPLSPIRPDAKLVEDFALLQAQQIVSLVLVSDPFRRPELAALEAQFDTAQLFKDHFVHDFANPAPYSKHHRYEVRRAHRDCETRIIDLKEYGDAWYGLYSRLIAKHGMTGIQAFSRDYFDQIAALNPVIVGAFHEETLISAHLWFLHEGYVYSHLAASSDEGYRLRAAYAVYDFSIQHFAGQKARMLDLGAGAGLAGSQGLTFLKQGFSSATVPCYLCCKILDEAAYAQLSAGKIGNYFPLYRTV